MDNKHDIDQLFQDRFQEASKQPPAFVWENLEALLRKRRRRLAFWWATGGLAGIGAAIALLSYNTLQSPSATPTPVLHSVAQEHNRATQANAQTHTHNEYTHTTAATKSPELARKGDDSRIYSTAAIELLTAIKAAEQNASVLLQPTQVTEPKTPIAHSNEYLPKEALQNDINTEAAKQLLAENNLLSNTPQAEPALGLLPRSDFKWPSVYLNKKSKTWPIKNNHIRKRKDGPKHCYDFERKPSVWLLDAYIGPSIWNKHLVNQSGPEWDAYRQKRLSSETRSLAFNGGLRATYLFKEHFKIGTGLHYDQGTEVFSYTDPSWIEYIFKQVINTQTGEITLDTIAANFGEKRSTFYNRFGLLDIPLEAGYELRSGRMGMALQGGVSLNVLFWKRGTILQATTGQPAVFTPGQPNAQPVFEARSGLSAHGSIQWFWHVRSKTRLFVEPSYRVVLKPITIANYPLRQQQSIVGLRLGVTRIF